MDFTLKKYEKLLNALKPAGYTFQTMTDFFQHPLQKSIILRHDVDARKLHSLKFAQIQKEMGIKGTYYFRMVSKSYDETVIREIEAMGHEIGYHYEDMDFAKGDLQMAIQLFEKHLKKLRKVADVKTVCMHGSPLSRYDNRDLWKQYDYRDYDVIGEPYFDIDFDKVFYLTDTGRRWDGSKYSVRDMAWVPDASKYKVSVKTSRINRGFLQKNFHSTDEIIAATQDNRLPHRVMINFHPQRWTNQKLLWTQELLLQNIKNIVKQILKRI